MTWIFKKENGSKDGIYLFLSLGNISNLTFQNKSNVSKNEITCLKPNLCHDSQEPLKSVESLALPKAFPAFFSQGPSINKYLSSHINIIYKGTCE